MKINDNDSLSQMSRTQIRYQLFTTRKPPQDYRRASKQELVHPISWAEYSLSLVSVNRGLLEPTPLIHSLMDCLRLLLCLHSKLWKVQERPNGLQSLKHLLPGRHWSNLDLKDWNLFAILNKCLHNLCSQWPKEYLSCTFILGPLLVKIKNNLGFI